MFEAYIKYLTLEINTHTILSEERNKICFTGETGILFFFQLILVSRKQEVCDSSPEFQLPEAIETMA